MDPEEREEILADGWPPIPPALAKYLEAVFFPARILLATDDIDEFRHYSGAMELVQSMLDAAKEQAKPSPRDTEDDEE